MPDFYFVFSGFKNRIFPVSISAYENVRVVASSVDMVNTAGKSAEILPHTVSVLPRAPFILMRAGTLSKRFALSFAIFKSCPCSRMRVLLPKFWVFRRLDFVLHILPCGFILFFRNGGSYV